MEPVVFLIALPPKPEPSRLGTHWFLLFVALAAYVGACVVALTHQEGEKP